MTLNKQTLATYKLRANNIASKKYYCVECDRSFRDTILLNKHLNGIRHNPRSPRVHTCTACNYTTNLSASMKIHNKGKKHILKTLIATN